MTGGPAQDGDPAWGKGVVADTPAAILASMPRSTRTLIRVVALIIVMAVAKLTGLIEVNQKGAPTDQTSTHAPPPGSPVSTRANGANAPDQVEVDEVEAAFLAKRSGVMLSLLGDVEKILPDDNDGSRHQKFIVKMASGRTILVSHNIDLAKRVPLTEGDDVVIHGQYEWNDRGGLIHWTHKDPGGRHAEGFIKHAGIRYE